MINYRMNFEMEIEMLVNVEKLDVWKFEDFVGSFDVSDDREDYKSGIRILKIELGCRGEEDVIEDVDVVNGEFKVSSFDDICDWLKGEIEEWWNDSSWDEFVMSDFEEMVNCESGGFKKCYSEVWLEELGYVYVRVEVQMLDKIVIVCSGILIGGFVFMFVVGG